MKTINKKNLTPLEHQLDGAAVNLPEEETKPQETEKNDNDYPDLDEDIMMYMINI